MKPTANGGVMMTAEALEQEFADLERRLTWKIGALVVGGLFGLTGLCLLVVAWMVPHP